MTTSFFLAGVMQGSRRAIDATDQSYRAALRGTIEETCPASVVHDPHELVLERYGDRVPEFRQALTAVADTPVVVRGRLDPQVLELLDTFHEMARLAAASDICVVWLPGHEPSMGTAAEMYAAFTAGRTVVTITDMRYNVAVLSCSTVILPDLATFSDWLAKEGDPLCTTS
ncbi:hypothetical protein [Streptomyces pseudovenezuelae]|uniref:DUF5753 domain-containing protein n=1 Tax=Streptomyces pseudovenezuelae TaxID=67350 RepID=A0ABT6M1R4_9ACTN|nr:hypothetical protein [Streptomyces pseudovenezuelae]MDH6222497.1 hypothetical protein [Streptomyces pseudovenezuelae]